MFDYIDELYLEYAKDPEKLSAKLADDLKIETNNLVQLMANFAETYQQYAQLAQKAKSEHSKQDRFVNNIIWPAVKEEARSALKNGNEKITVDKVDEQAMQDPMYLAATEYRADLEDLKDVFENARVTMRDKKDMILALHYRQLQELKD